MHFRNIPFPLQSLSDLTQIKKQLIARVHTHVQRDTGAIYDQLPLLPKDLDIVILRPQAVAPNPHALRIFRRDFTVRRRVVKAWLDWLIVNQPGYEDVQTNHALDAGGDEGIDVAAAPNLIAAARDLHRLRQQLRGEHADPANVPVAPRNYINLHGVRSTPLNDFNQRTALISLALPSLLPFGDGEFTQGRFREVDWLTWVRHALMWHDGGFARHPRFRNFYVNSPGPHQQFESMDQLQQALDANTPEGRALLQSVVRSGNVLQEGN
ncbi:hypothetical protein RB594_000709 [Gaeumannomyces avenae]